MKNNLTARTVRLLLQIAPVAIRFIRIRADTICTLRLSLVPGSIPELFAAHITQGIEAGFTLRRQGITPPVQVGHEDSERFASRRQKTAVPAGSPLLPFGGDQEYPLRPVRNTSGPGLPMNDRKCVTAPQSGSSSDRTVCCPSNEQENCRSNTDEGPVPGERMVPSVFLHRMAIPGNDASGHS